nr:T-cell receptor V beta CDR3 region {clone V5LK42} [mice, NOD, lymph node, Peptide Partial, 16 aa] [Mus sp.]
CASSLGTGMRQNTLYF